MASITGITAAKMLEIFGTLLPIRTSDGRVKTAPPTQDDDSAPRKYVDDSTVTTKQYVDDSTVTTKQYVDDSTVSTKQYVDDSTVSTKQYVDDSTVSTKQYVDTADLLRQTTFMLSQGTNGGGTRKVVDEGVYWDDYFYVQGIGMTALIPDGWFGIECPWNGTVIPVYGNPDVSSITVANNVVPLLDWQALYYDLPYGSPWDSDQSRFKIVDYRENVDPKVPPSWLLLVSKNTNGGWSPAYKWGDGRMMDPWKNLNLSNGWANYGLGYPFAAWRLGDDGKISFRGAVKSGTVGDIFLFSSSQCPEGLATYVQASGAAGSCRVIAKPTGSVSLQSYLTGGDNSFVSLEGLSWFPKGP